MTRAAEFQPDWASPPGETIAEILDLRGWALPDFAARIGTSLARAREIVSGGGAIDGPLARRLESVLGPSTTFWMQREQDYRESLDRQAGAPAEEADFLAKLPFADMRRFGWIDAATRKEQKLAVGLNFFGVDDMGEWHSRYHAEMAVAAFRTSPSFDANPYAVAAWLRRAEIESGRIKCRPWDRARFEGKLDELKRLSRIKGPDRFLPLLRAACAECGVAVVIARAPKGCRASGATRFLTPDKALIVLSFRYRADDQFWFTFFHEAAHLILHGKEALFLEDGSHVTQEEEREANDYAARVLIPDRFVGELRSLRAQVKPILAFARKLGISPGIVVGQLQHLRCIRPNRLNGCKRRYRWDELSNLCA